MKISYLLNIAFMLSIFICLPPVSIVTVSDVFSEENKDIFSLWLEGKWASILFAWSYTVLYKRVLILTIVFVETEQSETAAPHFQENRKKVLPALGTDTSD